MKKYDVLVFIGRFQPIHNSHLDIIEHAYRLASDVVIIVGSANQPRTVKNPWTQDERATMIKGALWDRRIDQYDPHVHIEYNEDSPYNDEAWVTRVQNIVAKYTNKYVGRWSPGMGIAQKEARVGIIGHKKEGDLSTFYLDYFPQWDFVDFGEYSAINRVDATYIRDIYLNPTLIIDGIKEAVSKSVFHYLLNWRNTAEYKNLVAEKEFMDKYKAQYSSMPYPPTFVTADAVVIQSGHVLMVKRGAYPGKGTWALPGGFLDAEKDRSLKECMLRELREETKLKVPTKILEGNIQEEKVFDAVGRSSRGRTITQAFKIVLPAGPLPRVRGSDDAEKAKWIPLSELDPTRCFEDHYTIITHFAGIER